MKYILNSFTFKIQNKMHNVICVALLFYFMNALAEVSGPVSPSMKQNFTAKLPHCISNPKEIEKIKEKIKANSKNSEKYSGYRYALESDADEELMARLIYSETKAARCPEMNSQVADAVTAVIANRIKVRKGNVRSVVFQRDQFASSLNIYNESAYEDFLCPNAPTLWELALDKATKAYYSKSKPTDTVYYFLYKHSPRWSKEPWKYEEDTDRSS